MLNLKFYKSGLFSDVIEERAKTVNFPYIVALNISLLMDSLEGAGLWRF